MPVLCRAAVETSGKGNASRTAWVVCIYNNYSDISVFSRDILKWGDIGVRAGGRGVLGVYYLLENIIHYYYYQSEVGDPPHL